MVVSHWSVLVSGGHYSSGDPQIEGAGQSTFVDHEWSGGGGGRGGGVR